MTKSDSKDIQKAILGVVTSSGNLTIANIAERLGLRPHKVRYYLDHLLAEKKILLARRVNYRVFGYDVVNVFFDLPHSYVKRGLDFLKKRQETFWLAHNIGPQKFEATLIVRDSKEFTRLFHEFSLGTGVHLRNPVVGNETETRHWGLRYLAGKLDQKPISFHTVSTDIHELDPLDAKIMYFIRRKLGTSTREIATAVGSAASTVEYRLERLRDWDALSEDIFFCTDDNNFTHAQLVLNLKVRTKQHEQAVVDLCASLPHAEGLITGLGCWDYKIILWANSIARLVEVEESIHTTLGKNIARSEMYMRNRILVGRYE